MRINESQHEQMVRTMNKGTITIFFFLFPKVNGQRKTMPRHRYLKICKNDKLDVYTVNDEDEYERES